MPTNKTMVRAKNGYPAQGYNPDSGKYEEVYIDKHAMRQQITDENGNPISKTNKFPVDVTLPSNQGVNLTGPIPSGTNTIGKVDVNNIPSEQDVRVSKPLPAGTQKIGKVDVSNFPNVQGVSDADTQTKIDTLSGKLDDLNTKIDTVNTNLTGTLDTKLTGSNVRESWSGSADVTKTFTNNMRSFSIINDGASDITFKINSISITVKPSEVFDGNFDSFTSVVITTDVPYRAIVRG